MHLRDGVLLRRCKLQLVDSLTCAQSLLPLMNLGLRTVNRELAYMPEQTSLVTTYVVIQQVSNCPLMIHVRIRTCHVIYIYRNRIHHGDTNYTDKAMKSYISPMLMMCSVFTYSLFARFRISKVNAF